MAEIKAVEFEAEVRQVRSMTDHSVNVILNLPESAIEQASWFLENIGGLVKCVVVDAED